MTVATRRTLAAAAATTLTLAALFPVLEGAHWVGRTVGAIVAVAVAGLLGRRLRVPRVLQPVLTLVVLAGYLVVAMVPATFDNALPTAETLEALRALITQAQADLAQYGPPITPRDGLVLVVASGVGLVAFLVDLIAVWLDRAALAGLPLLVLFAVPSALVEGGLGGTSFAFAAAGWLVLLAAEGNDTVRHWGAPLRSAGQGARPGGDDPGLGHVGRRIGVAALGVAILVPVLVPGLDQRLLGGGGPGGSGLGEGPSSATTYNPITRLREQLTLPQPRQLLVYTTEDPTPDYLRLTTLDTYTGAGWSSSRLEADRDDARVDKGVPRQTGTAGSPTRAVTSRIAIDRDNLNIHWLPLPFHPREISVEGAWLWDRASDTAFSASLTTRRLTPYVVQSQVVEPDADLLAGATGVDSSVQAKYGTALAVSAQVQALTERLTAGADNDYERAVAIQRFFTDPQNGFVYDLTPSLPRQGEADLDGFLRGRRGFCQQYATAMAVLLRASGLPSRVAVGFTPGQPIPGRKGTYSVTTSDAHAWPEAWFEGSGWVRFEPTPGAVRASQPEYSLPAPDVTIPDVPASAAPTPSASAFPRGFTDPDVLLDADPSTDSSGGAAGSGRGQLVGLVGLGSVLLVLTPAGVAALRRRRRGGSADEVWAQLRDDVTDVGIAWDQAQSPRATAARLAEHVTPEALPALHRIATATELVRYAPAGRAGRLDLRPDGREVRAGLRATAPRGTRVRAIFVPRSTLRWASHAISERVADLLDGVDQALNRLTSPFRRLVRER